MDACPFLYVPLLAYRHFILWILFPVVHIFLQKFSWYFVPLFIFHCSITIFYFAKEGDNCAFNPVYPDIHVPVKIPFLKGLGQKFCQPSGSGIDFGFFDIDDLSKPAGGDVFPLVISAESSLSSTMMDEESNNDILNTSAHAQITQAVIEKNNENHFQVKVIKQILWVDGVRYELREIYGISDSNEIINDKDSGKECVICMTEPKDTAVLPCRHMVKVLFHLFNLSFSFILPSMYNVVCMQQSFWSF